MFYLLALGSAALWGAADFLGGLTSRRASTLAVVVVSQAAGLVLLLALLPVLPAAMLSPGDLRWGIVAGLAGGGGVALLYRALAVGRMAVVAPTTALCAVAIPVAVDLVLGARPGLQTSIGIGLALVAIVLVSQQPSTQRRAASPAVAWKPQAGLGLAFASGFAIGLFFLSLARTSEAAGLWPLVPARVVSIGLFGLLAAAGRRTLRMPRNVTLLALTGGALDMLANAFYLVAARSGPLSVVVTLASLYPAGTVLLARFVLSEPISRRQWAGVGCALAAVVLIVHPAA